MDHHDHVALLREGIAEPGGTWADLGSGSGAFTLALAELLGPGAEIFSVDRDPAALQQQSQAMRSRYPDSLVHYLTADFTTPLQLPALDGVVMANSLHYVKDKDSVLQRVRGYLRPGGRLLLVEYNVDHGNNWVPYPVSYQRWAELARRNGFVETRLLARVPSRWLSEMYAALSI